MQAQVIQWRRMIHRHPEVGWTEFQTTHLVVSVLSALGFQVQFGEQVVKRESRMGMPDRHSLELARERALANGVPPEFLDQLQDGVTGAVGIWDTGRPGGTVAFRFDMDALPISEAVEDHLPSASGFRSQYEGSMHACGHDGHTSIGLGLAQWISEHADSLSGVIKLVFQPAEEGCRGAKAMVDAGVMDDVDTFIASHLGVSARRTRLISCSTTDFLSSTKLNVALTGTPTHAAMSPHEGRNALLAASTIALQVHAITRHGDGMSRVNVGILRAGEGRNIIASQAELQLETRGSTNAINQFMTDEAVRIIQTAAAMYGVSAKIEIVGQAISAPCDDELITLVADAARVMAEPPDIVRALPCNGSEDATYMMEAVQQRGGKATYLLIGSELSAGHHNSSFDFAEESLPFAVELFARILEQVVKRP